MRTRIGRWVYSDRSYYIAHIFLGIVVMVCAGMLIRLVFKYPLGIVLRFVSNDTVGLSASLLGFQLAGVAILISLEGNKKLSLLREINSDTMIYKIFISSMSMFLGSLMLMLVSLNLFAETEEINLCIKQAIDYFSVILFVFGMVFLFSSIRLLKWFCS